MDTVFERIEKMRAALRHDFGPDAESTIADIDRAIEVQVQKDPLLMYAGDLFSRAHIALRRQRIDTARRLQGNGVEENRGALDSFLWDSRLVDRFTADLQHGEKLVEVSGFELKTNKRSFTRDQLKRSCRMSVELNDAAFQKNFTSDAMVREAEARAAYREQPLAPGRTGVSSSDWR